MRCFKMIVFTAKVKVLADMPEDKEMQATFMANAQDIIQKGLARMTVPDWTVEVVDIEEDDDIGLSLEDIDLSLEEDDIGFF